MADNNQNNHRNEEIDLLDLFSRMGRAIGRFLNSIGWAVLISVMFLIRKWLPLTLSILMGIAISYILKIVFPPVYQGDMVLKTNIVPAAELISYINKLDYYCKEKNALALSSSLSIPQETAREVADIKAYWIIDRLRDGIPDYVDYKENHNVYDTINIRMQGRISIRIKARTPQELVLIRSGVLKYIDNNALFRQRNNERLLQDQELLTRLTYDISQLDSLQKVKYFEETRNRIPKTGGQIVFLQEQKTQLFYTDIYVLYTRKQNIESEQHLFNEIVTIISDITVPIKAITGTTYYSIIVVPLLFLLTLFFLIILRNRVILKDVYNSF